MLRSEKFKKNISLYMYVEVYGDMMKLWSIFCKNIKYFRYQNGFSQEQLGEMSELSARYISAIECGRYSPTIDTIEKIAEALGVEGYELFKKLESYDKLAPRIDIYKKSQRTKKDISDD